MEREGTCVVDNSNNIYVKQSQNHIYLKKKESSADTI